MKKIKPRKISIHAVIENSFYFFLGLVGVLLIGVLDDATGFEWSFSIFYLIPILFAAWRSGFRIGFLLSVAAAMTWFWVDAHSGHRYSYFLIPYWNALVRFAFFLIASFLLSKMRTLLLREKELSRMDSLTGLQNRRSFYELAGLEIHRAVRGNYPITLAYIDLDNFKKANDAFGHSRGDEILVAISRLLLNKTRVIDIIGRLGGDEFVLLLPSLNAKTAPLVVERFRKAVMVLVKENQWPISVSVGVKTFQSPFGTLDDMVRHVDALMYEAKKEGKDCIKTA